jgi:hypothetical protein
MSYHSRASFRLASHPRPWSIGALVASISLVMVISLATGAIGTPGHEASSVSSAAPSLRPAQTASISPPIVIPPGPHPTWINVSSTGNGTAPPPVFGGSAAYDPVDNETVYFGGCYFGGVVCTNQTWVFANGTWSNETNPFDAPPARSYASMDYDVNMRAVLLFGGSTGAAGGYADLNDTWMFSGGTWTNLTYVGPAPSTRYGAGLAFDPQPEENGSVLFGGYGEAGYPTDTWVWKSWSGWVPLSPSSPPPGVAYTAMAYDAINGYVVLYGGYGPSVGYSGETWELYSGQWWEVFPSASPVGRELTDMAYVPALGSVLLFGGWTGTSEANDTWLFSNGTWTLQSPNSAPPTRDSVGLALDATGTTPIAVGGDNLTQGYNDTWAYEYAPTVGIGANVSTAEVSENVTFSATVDGGTAPYRADFYFDDDTSAFVSGTGPTITASHVFDHPGTFTATVNVTDAVGAKCSAAAVALAVTSGPAISALALPTTGDVGLPVHFTGVVDAPGALPLQFGWEFGDGGNGTGPSAAHSFAAIGSYLATLTATDADHGTATASVGVVIVADPSVVVAASPSNPTPGSPATLYANVSGGTGPFSYSWQFGDGKTSSLPDPQLSFPSSGTYAVQVWMNDSLGGSAHGTLSLTVGSGASSVNSLLGYPWWFWAGVVGLAVVGAVGTVLLLRRGNPPGA